MFASTWAIRHDNLGQPNWFDPSQHMADYPRWHSEIISSTGGSRIGEENGVQRIWKAHPILLIGPFSKRVEVHIPYWQMLFGCSIFRAISRLLEFSSMIITILGLNIILADFGISIYENVTLRISGALRHQVYGEQGIGANDVIIRIKKRMYMWNRGNSLG